MKYLLRHSFVMLHSFILLMSSMTHFLMATGNTDSHLNDISQELTAVPLLLDWTPNTNHIGAYVALHNGYFEEEGLDVQISIASESSVELLVGSGKAKFGFSYQEGITLARASSTPIPIVAVAAVIQHNTSGFAAPTRKNITSPADFKNKKYGAFGSSIESATLDTIMKPYNASSKDITFIQAGTMDFFQATSTDTYDFAWVFEGWTLVEADINNYDMYYLPLISLDSTFDYYTPVIISSEQYITTHKDEAQSFMRGLKKGYEWAIQYPSQAADILLSYAPELNATLVHKSMDFLAPKFIDDAESWGIMKDIVWQRYTQWLKDNDFISQEFILDGIFTNELLE